MEYVAPAPTETAASTEVAHGDHHEAPGVSSLFSPALNLTILVSIMVYYLRKPICEFISSRHSLLRDEIGKTREQLRVAQTQYEEFSSKLKAIEAEIVALRDQSRQDAQAIKLRILSAAQKLSATVISDARLSAEGLFSELKGRLYSELGTRVLDRTETLMRERLTGDDRARIRREFSTQVESVQ